MTGYGTSSVKGHYMEMTIEVKAVNHRFLECHLKLPKVLQTMEDRLRKAMKEQVSRGKIDLTIHLEENFDKKRTLRLDEQLLDQYVEAIQLLKVKFGDSIKIDLATLLADQSIASVEEVSENIEIDEQGVLAGVESALQSFNSMRETEGGYLKKDMEDWLHSLQGYCEEIRELAPTLVDRYREKIETRIRSFLDEGLEADEGRLLTELAIFAEKVDVSEELVRLQAHINQYRYYLEKHEPIGRRLDFLIQEMNREVNTIGSKGADTSMRQYVVEMKGVLEKLKEQVQNVE